MHAVRSFWLWISLVCPSSYIVHKYLGWSGTLAYACVTAVALIGVSKVPERRGQPHLFGLALATFLFVAALFLASYPAVNTHLSAHGSDDDDQYNLGAMALLTGHQPYEQVTYLGNPLSVLPGALLLAMPFTLLGTSALQNLFWLPMFFVAVKHQTGEGATALRLAWIVLILAPAVMHDVVTGGGHASNTIYVLLGLRWLIRTSRRDLAAVAWGVALASRANFLFLVPLGFGWLQQHENVRAAWRAMMIACVVCGCLSLPFYVHDPDRFGPFVAATLLFRFDALAPHLGAVLIAVMAALSLGLAFTPMDQATLYRNCAVVQAFPIAAGLILSAM